MLHPARSESGSIGHAPTTRLALIAADVVASEACLRRFGLCRYSRRLEHFKDNAARAVAANSGLLLADTGDGFIAGFSAIDAAGDALSALLASDDEDMFDLSYALHVGEVVANRHGFVGIAMYEVVELCNAAEAGHVWASPQSAAGLTECHAERRLVELPRSGPAEVFDVRLGVMRTGRQPAMAC